jgi:hypothetical protein
MAKQKRKETQAAARGKLADAQAKLAAAQERRRRIATEGEQEVEQARQRAADRLAKATRDVERRAAKAARAEGKLLGLTTKPKSRGPAPSVPMVKVEEPRTASPVAADRLEEIAEEAVASDILRPDGAAADAEAQGLGRNERRLLAALGQNFDEGGATFSQWLDASTLSKRTFLRARKTLVDDGLVAHDGSGVGSRYALTASGRSEVEGAS